MIPPVEHHARPTQIPGMRHSTSELQGHDVDEAEAGQEAIRRSLGWTPMDPREHANSAEVLISLPSSVPRQNSMAPEDLLPPPSSGLSQQSSM